jgi:ubiquinone/menaquinone biosynthesis C-methylase UbiE
VTWLWILLVALGATALGLLIYWQLVVAEGTYLGPRAVSTGYDWFARRYDGVKRFDPYYERWFIAGPLMQALWPVQKPLLLDVAIGTGRLPVALLHEGFAGQVAGLDLSLGMLRQAMTKLEAYGDQVFLVRQDASVLPFDDGSFDAVTCLESLEFMPRPQEVLAEMVRVLAPGGILFLTNRIGKEARFLPGRAMSRAEFEQALARNGLRDVQVRAWQVDYDLVMARKAGHPPATRQLNPDVVALLRCPRCRGRLKGDMNYLRCLACGRGYLVDDGIVLLAGSD